MNNNLWSLQWNGIITRTLGEVYILSASWWIHVMLNWCCFGEEYALSYYVNQCCITVCRKLAQYLIRYFSISKAFNIYVLRRKVSLLVAMPVGKIYAWIGCHSNQPAICPRVPARCPVPNYTPVVLLWAKYSAVPLYYGQFPTKYSQ